MRPDGEAAGARRGWKAMLALGLPVCLLCCGGTAALSATLAAGAGAFLAWNGLLWLGVLVAAFGGVVAIVQVRRRNRCRTPLAKSPAQVESSRHSP